MSDDPSHIVREAKTLQVSLKELLKTRDVLDKEVEITRKNLRRQYLRLLFVHPYAKESRDAETHLWMQTSYSLISIYKQRIASLDRAIQNPPRQPQQNAQPQRVVEYRKLLQRFRQFLAEEERFWTQIILRFRRNFAVDAAEPILTALGIVPEEEPAPAGTDTANGGRRNQYQFPQESDTPENTPPATTASQRESRLAILSKALVCLGDIARYKEQYNEAGGRPRAGHEDGPPAVAAGKNSRGRRGGAPPAASSMLLPRMRDYSRARSCYEQARSLVPHDGNPSHQLAILCSYEKDMFNSLAHYYRALCVRQPYDTASENMGTVLSRALESWRNRRAKREDENQPDAGSLPPRLRVEGIKDKIIVLHAMWRVGLNDEDNMAGKILQDFEILVSERVLPLDMISKVIVLSQGALWKHRMVRQPSNGDKKARSPSTESRIATHLLDLHIVLLKIASRELSEVPPEDAAQGDLAQRITAVFRRTIPALRMAGKWVRANTRYLSQAAGITPESTRSRGRGREGKQTSSKDKATPAVTIPDLEAFWHEYIRYANILAATFPLDRLSPMTAPLEEDIEMVGFLPLRKYMITDGKLAAAPAGQAKVDLRGMPPLEDATLGLHPNEEQLMRISDMLVDINAVAEDENTPVALIDGVFEYRKQSPTARAEQINDENTSTSAYSPHNGAVHAERTVPAYDTDDDHMTSATQDDVPDDAVNHVLKSFENDDYDYEEIVYPDLRSPSYAMKAALDPSTPPRLSPTSPKSPISPPYSPQKQKPLSPPMALEPKTALPIVPAVPAAPAPSAGVTAAELLSNMRLRAPQHVRMASAPTAPLSFGPNGPVQSIWSDDHARQHTDSTLSSSTLGGTVYHNPSSHMPAQNIPIGYAPASWSQTLPSQTSTTNSFLQSSQATMYNSQPSQGSYPSPAAASNLIGGHTRLPSESVFLPRGPHVQSQPPNHRYDPLRSSLPIGDQVNIPARGLNGNGNHLPPSTLFSDTIYSSSPGAPSYQSRDTHDPYGHPLLHSRGLSTDRTYTAPFISSSSIWGNHPG
ncbi:hypothetical protein EIP91_010179 [Steccherinum ochraceum]|uniref:Protein SMG7 n=1 Tax=Steccherinum ochraceum TaxID=92696 RepID=A0A4R0RX47_9APHY|nr:hypothetical protein EIP91_010179 [Steccherinum ochraceum]